MELSEANDFVARTHRHHKPVRGHRFSLGAALDGILVGVAIIGRPVARFTDQKKVVEVTRMATDGTKNACSFLYAASARCARCLGYWKIQTFILAREPGISLMAAGWRRIGASDGGDWNCPSRDGRRRDQPQEPKIKFGKMLRGSEGYSILRHPAPWQQFEDILHQDPGPTTVSPDPVNRPAISIFCPPGQ